jgi:hypothetical protein
MGNAVRAMAVEADATAARVATVPQSDPQKPSTREDGSRFVVRRTTAEDGAAVELAFSCTHHAVQTDPADFLLVDVSSLRRHWWIFQLFSIDLALRVWCYCAFIRFHAKDFGEAVAAGYLGTVVAGTILYVTYASSFLRACLSGRGQTRGGASVPYLAVFGIWLYDCAMLLLEVVAFIRMGTHPLDVFQGFSLVGGIVAFLFPPGYFVLRSLRRQQLQQRLPQ